jgi:hypothetical protein
VRDPERWNDACDYAINPLVVDAGMVLPKGAYLDARFKGKSAEEIYGVLTQEASSASSRPRNSQRAASLAKSRISSPGSHLNLPGTRMGKVSRVVQRRAVSRAVSLHRHPYPQRRRRVVKSGSTRATTNQRRRRSGRLPSSRPRRRPRCTASFPDLCRRWWARRYARWLTGAPCCNASRSRQRQATTAFAMPNHPVLALGVLPSFAA